MDKIDILNKNKYNKKNDTIKSLVVTLILLFVLILITKCVNSYTAKLNKYLINYGKIEKVTINDVYVTKNETLVNIDTSKTVIPIISEKNRVAKDSSIAFYKDDLYDKKISEIKKLDARILEIVKQNTNLSFVDTKNIEDKILKNLYLAESINSYDKLREISRNIEELSLEKTSVYAQSAPSGDEIKQLLEQRKEYSNSIIKSEQNINSPVSGIVSYKLDGLEQNNVEEKINFDELKKNIDNNRSTKYGVKVVNNFYAKMCFELDKTEDIQVKINSICKVRLLEKNAKEIVAKIVDIEERAETKILTLEIRDGIEELLDIRKINCEIVWWSYEGLKIPNEAIQYKNDIAYITLNRYSELHEVPVKVLKDNGRFSIIQNYSSTELEELNLENSINIKIYDEINLENKK